MLIFMFALDTDVPAKDTTFPDFLQLTAVHNEWHTVGLA